MTIDLEELHLLSGLDPESVGPLVFRAAVALQRRHRPGVSLSCEVQNVHSQEDLGWRQRSAQAEVHEDFNRSTEEGAEAIALALSGIRYGWRVERRLQSRLSERADWLLTDDAAGKKIVLEVGGTDAGDLSALLKRKIDQARKSPFSGVPAACVVGFEEPRALLWRDDGPR